jgi:hypothetical protein
MGGVLCLLLLWFGGEREVYNHNLPSGSKSLMLAC